MNTSDVTTFGSAELGRTPVSREWMCEHRVVYHSISDSSRATVDAARKMLRDSMVSWPADKLYLDICDYSSPHVSLTPYAQQMLKELGHFRPELKGYIAFVTPQGHVNQLMQLFLRTARGLRESCCFATREEALAWLLQKADRAFLVD